MIIWPNTTPPSQTTRTIFWDLDETSPRPTPSKMHYTALPKSRCSNCHKSKTSNTSRKWRLKQTQGRPGNRPTRTATLQTPRTARSILHQSTTRWPEKLTTYGNFRRCRTRKFTINQLVDVWVPCTWRNALDCYGQDSLNYVVNGQKLNKMWLYHFRRNSFVHRLKIVSPFFNFQQKLRIL